MGFAITGAVVGAGFDGAGWAGAVVGCTAAVVGAAIAGAVVGATAAVVGTAVGSSAASLHANAANATIDINMANSSPSFIGPLPTSISLSSRRANHYVPL